MSAIYQFTRCHITENFCHHKHATNYAESWEVNKSPASQYIPRILANPTVHDRIHKSPTPHQISAVCTTPSHFFENHLIKQSRKIFRQMRLHFPKTTYSKYYWLTGFSELCVDTNILSMIRVLKTLRRPKLRIFRNDWLTFSKPDQFLSLSTSVQDKLEYTHTHTHTHTNLKALK
jgi:hypothetical protein